MRKRLAKASIHEPHHLRNVIYLLTAFVGKTTASRDGSPPSLPLTLAPSYHSPKLRPTS
jgi:hypothetical protein